MRSAVAVLLVLLWAGVGLAHELPTRDAALASGAQYVSTDYLWPEPRVSADCRVALPAGAAVRCNPLRRPQGCGGEDLERQGC